MTDNNLPATLSTPSAPTITAPGSRITPDDLLAMYEEEEREERSKSPAAKEESVDYPVVKASFKDSDLSVPEEASFPVKVGKKTVPIKLKALISSFSTKEEFDREMDRRVGKVTAREREFQAKIDNMNKVIGEVIEKAVAGDPILAFRGLCVLACQGTTKDPVEMEVSMLDNLRRDGQIWAQGTPEQKRLFIETRKRENAERKVKELNETQKLTEAQSAALAEVDAACSELGLSRAEFFQARADLIKNHVGEGKALATEDEADAATTKEFIYRVVHEAKVVEAIGEAAKDKASDEDFITLIFNETFPHHKDLSAQDIVDVVREATKGDAQAVENLNRKVQKAAQAGFGSQSATANSNEQKTEEDDELEDFFFGKSKRTATLSRLNR